MSVDQKQMRVFTREVGSYHHCQIRSQGVYSAYERDWLEDLLKSEH